MLTLEQFHSGLANGSLARAHHIRLSDGLTEFPAALYQLTETLEVLDLSGNQLSTLPDDLTRFARLRILFASNNPFSELPRVLGHMPQLEMVGFKACRIMHVPEDSLPARLRWLILTDNHVHQLPESMGQCTRLQKLMLSCNQLRQLPQSLQHCQALELLRIASNRFEDAPEVIFRLPRLAWLALAGNPMTQKQELALKVFKTAQTSDGTPQSELAAGIAAGQHPHLLTPLAQVLGAPEGQMATALPLLDSAIQPLAGPPSFDSCTRDVYDPELRLQADQAQQLLQGIRSAITHLHGRGLLHGDLYAHNILCNLQTGQAVLSDFGAAALLQGLPETQQAQLQQIELRALRHLENEVQALVG